MVTGTSIIGSDRFLLAVAEIVTIFPSLVSCSVIFGSCSPTEGVVDVAVEVKAAVDVALEVVASVEVAVDIGVVVELMSQLQEA